jgi:hypothetical protein
VPHCTFSETEFNILGTKVSCHTISQNTNNEYDADSATHLLSMPVPWSEANVLKEYINQVPDSDELSSCSFDEPLFPGYELENIQPMDYAEGISFHTFKTNNVY